jgi:D-inositol-3-phosphate glycosyltransferase
MGKLTRRLKATLRVWRPGGAHLAMFPAPAPPVVEPPLPAGAIDLPAPGSVLPRGPVVIRGWALLPEGFPSHVELWVGDVALGRARLGVSRPDLVAPYGSEGRVAGFEHAVDLGELIELSGDTTVRAVATGSEGDQHSLPPLYVHVAPVVEHLGDEFRSEPKLSPAPEDGPRVVVFTHRLDLGGAQLILLDLLLAMRRESEISFVVVSPRDGELRGPLEEAGIHVHVAGPIPLDDPVSYLGRVHELAAWISRGGFDVALVNTAMAFPGADAALQAGLPALWAIHESYTPAMLWEAGFGGLHPQVRRRADAALAAADAAMFEAEATRRLYVSHVKGPCITRPYGVDLAALEQARATFDVAQARRERAVPPAARVVLAVGVVEPRKAHIPLIQAFGRIADRHPDALLVVIGAGGDPTSQGLKDYARDCSWADQVRVIPLTADTWPWYGLADLLVCPSDLESLPRCVLEAMWWETPVVATSVFGLPELIDHGRTGWLCPPRDIEALAGALDVALSAPDEQRQAVARTARELVCQRHDLESYASDCRELLQGLAAPGRPAGELSLAVTT